MRSPFSAQTLVAAGLLVSSALAAPARLRGSPTVPLQQREEDQPVSIQTPYGPTDATGSLLGPLSLAGFYPGEPVNTELPATIPASDYELAAGQTEDEDLGLYLDFTNVENPQPIRGGTNAPTDPGPRNRLLDTQNSDSFAPPGTDSGSTSQAKWPLGLSHNRHGLENAGWARQQNIDQLPAATAMAGVDMHLEPYAYRELHWHKANEWSLILNGTVRLNAVNEDGETFTDDLQAGDVWFFPAGVPHSIQAFGDGVEFLLVFDEGGKHHLFFFLKSSTS